MKVAQVTHHQGDIRYRMARGIQCSSMSLISVCWTLFKSVSIWDLFDLDCILQEGVVLFKLSINTDILGWKFYHRSLLLKTRQ